MEIKAVLPDPVTGNPSPVTIDASLTFTSDDHIGTPWEPYVIQLSPADGMDSVTGNPSPVTVHKVLHNGILYIIRNGEYYDATGKKLTK
jgi:hypothetical protein